MNDKVLNVEPLASCSGEGYKRKRSSSSSNSSTSTTTTSSSSDYRRRSRRRKHKTSKRSKHSDPRVDVLMKEIGELKHLVALNNDIYQDSVSIYPEGGELDQQLDFEPEQNDANLSFEIKTKLKEPPVPKTPDNFLKMLSDVQKLGTTSWSDVRYADTQKLYNHTPGFVDLEINDEIKLHDGLRHLMYADRSYAAFTYCILKQKMSLQEGIRSLLLWAKNTDSINAHNLR